MMVVALPTPAAMRIIDDVTGLDASWAFTTSAANQGTEYEVILDATGLAPGTYSATMTAGPVEGYTDTSIPINLEVIESGGVLTVTRFVLVDAITNTDIATLTEGAVVDISGFSASGLNIRAETTADVESVRLELSGTKTSFRTENVAPYALFGDASGNYYSGFLPVGEYAILATPYSDNSLGGTQGTSLTVNFALSQGANLSLRLYPNPAVTEVKVSMNEQVEKSSEIFNVSVYDMQGKLIHEEETKAFTTGEVFSMPVGSLPAGVYYITMFGNKGTVEKKTFVVDK